MLASEDPELRTVAKRRWKLGEQQEQRIRHRLRCMLQEDSVATERKQERAREGKGDREEGRREREEGMRGRENRVAARLVLGLI